MSDAAHNGNDPLALLRQRYEREQAALAAVEAAWTPEDQAETEFRAKIGEVEAKRKAAEARKRDLDLNRRYDVAKAAHPKWHIAKAVIAEYGDTFLVRHDSAAFSAWQAGITKSFTDKSVDRTQNERDYVMACIIDWNGMDLSTPMSPGGELIRYLKEHPGIVSTLAGVAGDLAGVSLDARKS